MRAQILLGFTLLLCSQISFADPEQFYKDIADGKWQGTDVRSYPEAYFSFATQVAEESLSNGAYDYALQVYRLIQHGIHQYDGVNSPKQVAVIQRLAFIYQKMGKVVEGDKQANFAFLLATQNKNQSIEDVLKAFEDLANYYTEHGNTELAIETYTKILTQIRKHPDSKPIHYIGPYRGIAQIAKLDTWYLRRAIKSMEDLDAMTEDTDLNPVEKLAIKLELGDLYVLHNNNDKAANLYRNTWRNKLYRELAQNEFHQPKLIDGLATAHLSYTDNERSHYVDIEVDIGEQGKIIDYKVLDEDLSKVQLKNLKKELKHNRFRPQMVEGELVASRSITIRRLRNDEVPIWKPDIEFSM